MTKPLRRWRAEHLLSTRRLAAEAGISNKTIVQIENGRQTPTFATMQKITRVLQVDPRDVTEFALALAERARDSAEMPENTNTSLAPHVLCVSALPSFLTIVRRFLHECHYAVTSMIGVPATADQVACLKPDVVVLDLGAETHQAISFINQLQHNVSTLDIPIVVTGRDRRRMEERLVDVGNDARQRITFAPFDRDLRALLTAMASLIDNHDGLTGS